MRSSGGCGDEERQEVWWCVLTTEENNNNNKRKMELIFPLFRCLSFALPLARHTANLLSEAFIKQQQRSSSQSTNNKLLNSCLSKLDSIQLKLL